MGLLIRYTCIALLLCAGTATAVLGQPQSHPPLHRMEAVGSATDEVPIGVRHGAFPPYPAGVVGDDRLITATAERIMTRSRDGLEGERWGIDLDVHWGFAAPDVSTGRVVSKTRMIYDPYGAQVVKAALAHPRTAASTLLLKTGSSTDAPVHAIDLDPDDLAWGEDLNVGFNKDWIVVQVNLFAIHGGAFVRSQIYVIDKQTLYGGALAYTLISDATIGASQVPALTYDPAVSTLYLVQNDDGNQDGSGYVRLYAITGPVGAESLTHVGFAGVADPWADVHPVINGGFAPQPDTDRRLMLGDSRIQSVVFRNNAIWAAQSVFLPAAAPVRAAVQWWQLSTAAATIQRGRVDGGTLDDSQYGYPSLAVNARGDMLVGFTHFSSTTYPTAAYAYRSFRDPLNATRAPHRYGGGTSPYRRERPDAAIPWAGSSTTVVDPVNDLDMWTLQTATTSPGPLGGVLVDRWTTWWGHVIVPRLLGLAPGTAGPSLAGVPVSWTADAVPVPGLQYQFSVQRSGSSAWTVVQDFGSSTRYTWTPDQGGTHTMRVRLRYTYAGIEFEDEATATYPVIARPIEIVALTSTAPPSSPAGTPITWTVAARYGTAPLEYRFWRYDVRTRVWTEVQPYTTAASYTWTPAADETGRYLLQAWVRSAGGTTHEAFAATDYFTIRGGALVLAGDPIHGMPAQTGKVLSWAVQAWGGDGVPEYRFDVFSAATGAWTAVQDYSRANTVAWTPAHPGTCRFRARARTAGSGVEFETETQTSDFEVGVGPVIVLSLDADRSLPLVAGDTVTWSAVARGGDGLEFRFVLHDMAANTHRIQDWGPAATFSGLVPAPADSPLFAVEVWARSAGTAAPYNGYRSSPIFTVAAAPGPLSLLRLRAEAQAPIAPGTPITWTAELPQASPGLLYRFSIPYLTYPVVREYATARTFTWTPAGTDVGLQELRVEVKRPDSVDEFDAFVTTDFRISASNPVTVAPLAPDRAGVLTTNTPLTWTASATGGTAPLEYRYWLFDGTSWQILRDYSTDRRVTWMPPADAPGAYILQVWVRSQGSEVSYEGFQVEALRLEREPFSLTAIAPLPTPAYYTDTYAWKVAAAGGQGPLQFQFVMEEATGSAIVQDFSESDVYHWVPGSSGIGSRTLHIHARNAITHMPQGSASIPITVSYPRFAVAVTADRPAAVGTPITWTATVTGGVPPLAFTFWRYDAVHRTWTVVQPAGPSPTYTWTPSPGDEGRYVVHVGIYSTLAPAAWTWASTDFFTINGGPVVIAAVEPSTAVPARTGAAIGWQATTYGGTGAIEYRFDVRDVATGSWTLLRDYAAGDIAVWTPVTPGSSAVRVRARAVGSAVEFEAERVGPTFDVVAGPIRLVSLTADRLRPFRAGTPVTWAAVAAGGTGACEYRFVMHDFDEATAVEQPFGAASHFVWAGGQSSHVYLLEVWVRASGSTAPPDAYANTDRFWTTLYSHAGDGLVADVTFPAPPGTRITWTALPATSPPNAEYKFEHWTEASGWVVARDFNPSRTFMWAPGPADSGLVHRMRWVMPDGRLHTSSAFSIGAEEPLAISNFSCTPTSVPAGAPVRCDVVAPGGSAPREYRFWRRDVARGTWIVARDYDASPSMTWYPDPGDAGEHYFQVWARSSGSPASVERWSNSSTITVRLAPPEVTLWMTAGTAIWTFTFEFMASLASGSEPVEYEFSRQGPAGDFVVVRPYDRSPWYIWKPSRDSVPPPYGATPYVMRVTVRSATTGTALTTAERTVTVVY